MLPASLPSPAALLCTDTRSVCKRRHLQLPPLQHLRGGRRLLGRPMRPRDGPRYHLHVRRVLIGDTSLRLALD